MGYLRMYADAEGASHFEETGFPLTPVESVPPAPPRLLAPLTPATGMAFISIPAGYRGDWEPSPGRQLFFVLSGGLELTVSDGASRRVGAGDVVLMEDTASRGHTSRILGGEAALTAVVQLAG
ncbi:MAG TPA: cupin domain-containing protein [Thermomicrobiales bacterium]|nr:cupin domain-containing protein [Thermomicrobiales bacterium]